MDIFVEYDPEEATYSAIKQVALTGRDGFSIVTAADLAGADEALAVFIFSDNESALALCATMRTLVHEHVFGTFTAPDICGDCFVVWFVDAGATHGEECRAPGLHIHDFRK